MTHATFADLAPGYRIDGPAFAVSRESIRAFAAASLDFNPLHLDDDYMTGSFGKTNFGGIIMHGMNNFGLLTRMLTDWAYAAGWRRAGSSRSSRATPSGRTASLIRSVRRKSRAGS